MIYEIEGNKRKDRHLFNDVLLRFRIFPKPLQNFADNPINGVGDRRRQPLAVGKVGSLDTVDRHRLWKPAQNPCHFDGFGHRELMARIMKQAARHLGR